MGDVARRTCRGGSWLAVLGTDLTVVLPGHDRARAARVWELVDGGAGFAQVLDALVAPALSEAGEFVLVRVQGRDARVLVRGTPSVSVRGGRGPIEVAAGDLVWAEQSLEGVEAMELALPDSEGLGGPGVPDVPDGSGEEWPAVPGLVRVGAVRWGAGRPSVATSETPVPTPPVPEPPVPEPPVPEPPVPEPPVPMPPGPDRDGLTRFGQPPAPPAPAGIPGQPAASAVLSAPVARLVLSTGETVDVDRAVIIGRAPEVRRHAGEEPRLVTVPSPGQEISSTHLEVRPGAGADHGAATATDLGSTNGTLVRQPGLPPEELQPGIAVALVPGAVLDLGDGLTIQVTRP